MFILDKKFVKDLRSRLIATENRYFGKGVREKVPSFEHLQEIVSNIFWASTQFEEGKLTKFRVIYSTPTGIEHLSLRFSFLSAKQLNVNELVKLAPAVVPPGGNVCIYPFMDNLVIQGMTTTGSTSITFEVIDPARIVVKFPLNSVIAEITGEKSEFIKEAWSGEGLELISAFDPKEKNHDLRTIISFLYGEVTRGALTRMRLLGHGGTLLLVEDNNSWKKSIEKPIAFDCEQRYNGIRHIEDSLRAELKSASSVMARGLNLLARPDYSGAIGDTARTLAYLSGIDGAAVLTKGLDVLAFGAKVKEKQKGRGAEKVTRITPYESDTSSEKSLTDAFRGKRHLSTARFVLDNPDSVAFTVSQDGGVTGFVVKNKKLHAYKGLELLL